MVSLLFGIESTVFSLVCQKAQTQLSSLSYCPSVSSVLCFLAPEFATALEPFWTFVYFFLLTCAFHSLHHALLCLWNSAHLLRPSFSVTLNEKTSLLPFLPLGPYSTLNLCPDTYHVVYLFTCLSLSLSNKKRWDWGPVSVCKGSLLMLLPICYGEMTPSLDRDKHVKLAVTLVDIGRGE